MSRGLLCAILCSIIACESARGDGIVVFSGEKKRNNLVSELLEVSAVSKSGNAFKFRRSGADGFSFPFRTRAKGS